MPLLQQVMFILEALFAQPIPTSLPRTVSSLEGAHPLIGVGNWHNNRDLSQNVQQLCLENLSPT